MLRVKPAFSFTFVFICIIISISSAAKVVPFSPSEIDVLLNTHNSLRSVLNAYPALTNLTYIESILVWNPNNTCTIDHTPIALRTNTQGYKYLGENMAFSTGAVSIAEHISGWVSEKNNFIYGPLTYNNYQSVGHYTQMIWHTSIHISCKRLDCISEIGYYIIACDYGEGGNYIGQYPYIDASQISPTPTSTPSLTSSPTISISPSLTSSISSSNSPSQTPSISISPTTTRSITPSISKTPSISTSYSSSPSTTPSLSPSFSPSSSPPVYCGSSICNDIQDCINNTCQCPPGFYPTSNGANCNPYSTVPTLFIETQTNKSNSPSNWVYAPYDPNTIGSYPQIDMISEDSNPHYLEWVDADQWSSLERTTLYAEVLFTSPTTIVGLGLRYDQGPSRSTDAIQWDVQWNSNQGSLRWVLIWSNNPRDYAISGNQATDWNTEIWHQISFTVRSQNYSGRLWAVSEVMVDGNVLITNQAVRPYLSLGSAYLYSKGSSSWRNVEIITDTTLIIALTNCMSDAQFAAMVARVLGIPVGSVVVKNTTDSSGRCVGQSNRRQAGGAAVGDGFTFSLSSAGESGSTALASKLMYYAKQGSALLSETGGVKSVDYAPVEATTGEGYTFVNLEAPVDVGTAVGGGGGLSGGAVAGIVAGSVVGAAIVVGIVAALVAAVVLVARRRNALMEGYEERAKSQEPVAGGSPQDEEMQEEVADAVAVPVRGRSTTQNSSADVSAWRASTKVPSSGVDIYRNTRHGSIGGRSPSLVMAEGNEHEVSLAGPGSFINILPQ